MNDFTSQRQRYTQIFVTFILISSLYMLSQSISGGFASFEANLPGRGFLIQNFSRLRLKIGDRVFPVAVVGKNGWMELSVGYSMDVFQNIPTLPSGGRESIQKNLKILYDKLRERNITLVVVIVPIKSTIYPDKIPSEEIQKASTQAELDMLVDLLQKDGPPILIDLRPAFLEARQKREIYFRTDTHWNAYGALIAYQEILNRLSQSYPELAPNKINSFKVTVTPPYLHDIAKGIGANHLLENGYIITPPQDDVNWIIYDDNDSTRTMKIATSSRDKLPTLLMYHDSFGGYFLNKIIASHFSQSTFISNTSTYPDTLTFKQIEATKPDIVILEFVERNQFLLYNFLNNFGLEAEK
jgi:alginate O-acetyltransferase complex protein AlgJ